MQLIILALTWIPPILIAYRSQGFWQRLDHYSEQGNIHFKYQVLVIMDTSTDGSYVAWSTYQNFNQLQMDHLRVPILKARENDLNGDGLNDELSLRLEMPLLDSERVHGLKLMIIFDYLLSKFSYFQMESLAYVSHTSPLAGGSMEVVGDLSLQQTQPLGHKDVDTRYNESIIDGTSIYAESYSIPDILTRYTARNVSTVLDNSHTVWLSGRGADQPFTIKAHIRYREQHQILFTPGFWQLIKGGWIQYVSILVVFWFVFTKIKVFIFQNQLVTTIVERPFKDKTM